MKTFGMLLVIYCVLAMIFFGRSDSVPVKQCVANFSSDEINPPGGNNNFYKMVQHIEKRADESVDAYVPVPLKLSALKKSPEKTTCKTGKLLVILVDGLRHDYVNNPALIGFNSIEKNGVRARHVVPVTPANSYPNWYSITTGKYSDEHGIVQNYIYDKIHNSYFLMAHADSFQPMWWDKAEPIWVTAEKSGYRTAMYWWDGCQVPINGTLPTFCIPYKGFSASSKKIFELKLTELAQKLNNDVYRLGMIYYEGPDSYGHRTGPKSVETMQSVRQVDTLLDHLNRVLDPSINLVIVSDHGMTSTDLKSVKLIHMEDYVKMEDIQVMLDRGALSMLHPVEGRTDQVYETLKKANIKGLQVFKKEEIPAYFHFGRNRLVSPIVLMAEKGYFISPLKDATKMKPYPFSHQPNGQHGYSNTFSDMWAVFFAQGPAFRKGIILPPIEMVDIYNAMCYALGLKPQPNSGSWSRIRDALNPNYCPELWM